MLLLLALFSTFVRRLRLFHVRALKRPGPSRPTAVNAKPHAIFPVPYAQYSIANFAFVDGRNEAAEVNSLDYSAFSESADDIHARNHASARARRQGPGVPVPLRKAPTQEAMCI
jgi:hypothetical protein